MDNIKNAILGFLVFTALTGNAQTEEIRYITDQFEITLQKNKDPNSQVVARIKSGAPLRFCKLQV